MLSCDTAGTPLAAAHSPGATRTARLDIERRGRQQNILRTMRVFLRVDAPTCTSYPTYDLPEGSTVAELRRMIYESRQAAALSLTDIGDMRIFVQGAQLRDEQRLLLDCVPEGCERRALCAVLRGSPLEHSMAPTAVTCAPAPDVSGVEVGSDVMFALPAGVAFPQAHAGGGGTSMAAAVEGAVQVSAAKDWLLSGCVTLVSRGQPQPGSAVGEQTCHGRHAQLLCWSPRVGLQPNTVHSVYVRFGDVECGWQFKTAGVAPVRVLVSELVQEGSVPNKPTLLSLKRKQGLLAELHGRIMARFGLCSAEGVSDLVRLSPDVPGVPPGLIPLPLCREGVSDRIVSDVAVASLKEYEQLTFRRCVAGKLRQSNAPPLGMPGHTADESLEEYVRTHWVNPEAGFYALCGKMTAAEETSALLDIVQAFSVDDADDGVTSSSSTAINTAQMMDPTATGPTAAAANHRSEAAGRAALDTAKRRASRQSSARPQKRARNPDCGCDDLTLSVVPGDIIQPLWSGDATPTIFHEATLMCSKAIEDTQQHDDASAAACASITDRLAGELTAHGFAVVQLSDTTADTLTRLQSATQAFFKLETSRKESCSDPAFQYVGYVHRPAFEKELFQVRLTDDGAPAVCVGTGGEALLQSAAVAFQTLGRVAWSVLTHACEKAGLHTSALEPVRERWNRSNHHGGPAYHAGFSQSNMSLFHYYSARDCVHCPQHSDVGLITIIPTAVGAAGLHIFDWRRACWLDVEANAPPNCAVVLTGESLSRLTNGRFTPTMHEVSQLRSARNSVAFQLLADADAVLSCEGEDAETAAAFVDRVSASRISSNFARPRSTGA